MFCYPSDKKKLSNAGMNIALIYFGLFLIRVNQKNNIKNGSYCHKWVLGGVRMNRLISIILLMVISVTVNAATFNVVSGTFEAIDQLGFTVDQIGLTGNGVLVEGVYNGSAAGIA